MHIAEVVTIAKSLPLLRLNTYKSLILSYSADYRRILWKNRHHTIVLSFQFKTKGRSIGKTLRPFTKQYTILSELYPHPYILYEGGLNPLSYLLLSSGIALHDMHYDSHAGLPANHKIPKPELFFL